ncbi:MULTISPECIES: HD-GYP domain-containing protein [Clostridium]|uniref:Putative domain HDIG-containing protein n=1 Tax=Clostridium saccharoperbutylacetonicum N1-4(HMT) TaxID=931276 RepID=M1MUR5_9CLOT|nr:MULTISPECIES: HD-GYP domain-containing protein [Clostridium]AGF55247.1 putative domain HDIG-containing protein [Clostridium saccharoperbutylacetonicum N1-4(HMT)]AQR94137.1 cyclic di-GMP phosphodiesterase response regulator RpfG [Clostridium saccharoperbutylacetonicum]NRT64042.1 HD-GYP domain-containing protein (c-di-GMP phosphodiesterase class II) [Clostridium saccharoperbutylacetonicum]NSB27409.1 HD-GYP domain-containing protein (c-di-GMP phosphodiesterase class II) [Clostridium saccharoper
MRLVPIESVKPNTVLGKTLYDVDGRVLLRAGVVLREVTIAKIKEINILSIYIVDKYSDEEIDDIIKPEIRQKAIITIKEAFSNIGRLNTTDQERNKESDYTWQEQSYFYNIGKMAVNIIEDILKHKDVLLALVDIRSMDNYMYSHSVNVAVISLTIGITFQMPKKKLEALCIGALIHDIGKSFLPKRLSDIEAELTADEKEMIKQHPRLGYKYLSSTYNINSLSKMIVLQHHERPDGKGYPDRLNKDNIVDLSYIVSIADAYDNLSTDLPEKRAMFPSDVLEYLMSNAGSMFDYNIVNIFCRIVIPYPKGTIVEISTGERALVRETIPGFPLRPILKIIESQRVTRIGDEINLIKEISIVITKVVHDV